MKDKNNTWTTFSTEFSIINIPQRLTNLFLHEANLLYTNLSRGSHVHFFLEFTSTQNPKYLKGRVSTL